MDGNTKTQPNSISFLPNPSLISYPTKTQFLNPKFPLYAKIKIKNSPNSYLYRKEDDEIGGVFAVGTTREIKRGHKIENDGERERDGGGGGRVAFLFLFF